MHPRVTPHQVQRIAVVGQPGMRQYRDESGMSSEYLTEYVQTGVGPGGAWTVPAMHDNRDARFSQQPPRPVKHWVPRVEATYLHVHLDATSAGGQRSLQVFDNTWLGIERCREHGLRHGGGEFGDPAVEPVRHAGSMRVDQRREGSYVHRAQHREAIVLGQPVVHRPWGAVALCGLVEEGPHLGHHLIG